ncbi:MAG: hypothetical protein ACK5MR_18395 [Cumulibacter sp.]
MCDWRPRPLVQQPCDPGAVTIGLRLNWTLTSVFSGINDPDVVNSRYVAPDSLFNAGSTEYPDLQKYGIAVASTLDPAERMPAYEKSMDARVESSPHLLPVCTIHMASAYNSNVSGVGQKANGYPDLRGRGVAKD